MQLYSSEPPVQTILYFYMLKGSA